MKLGYYDVLGAPTAVDIPEGYEEKTDQVISKHQGIKVRDEIIVDSRIIGIFANEEWDNLIPILTKPSPAEEFRQQAWYIKSKTQRTALKKK